jgi:hypothetical protein
VLIECSVSYNGIEGVEVEQKRIGMIIIGQSSLRERNEEEAHGDRNTLRLIDEAWLMSHVGQQG